MAKGKYERRLSERDWKPEHDQRLSELLELGLSFSQVRDRMNEAFPGMEWTRNAVLGRAARAGFKSKHEHGGRKGRPAKVMKSDRVVKAKRQPKVIEAPVIFKDEGDVVLREEGALGVKNQHNGRKTPEQVAEARKGHLPSIIEIAPLTSVLLSDCPANGCKWPTCDDPFMVCGAPIKLGSYCSRHGNVAFRELPTMKRNREYTRRGTLDQRKRIINDDDAQWLADRILDDEVKAPGIAPEVELLIKDLLDE